MVLAALVLLPRLGAVQAPIWDEAYYLTSLARMHEGRVQFASHPPLGLLLIAAGDTAWGGNAGTDWRIMAATRSVRAEAMPRAFDYTGPRLASALAGVLACGLMALLLSELSGSAAAGLALALLFAFDPALVAQVRAAQLDGFQIAFVAASLLCLARGLRPGAGPGWCAGFGAMMAGAVLVRANALVLAPLGLVLVWQAWRSKGPLVAGLALSSGLSAALALGATVMAAMLATGPLPPDFGTPAGVIDAGHVSGDYAQMPRLTALVTYSRDYARFVHDDLTGMTRTDRNASHPWQWLLGSGAITYRWEAGSETVRTVGLVPGRPLWLASALGVLAALAALRRQRDPLALAFLAGWVLTMASLAWLDTMRVMYAYHYFLPLILGLALLARAWAWWGAPSRLLAGLVGCGLVFALPALPLALAVPVPKAYCRLFLPDCGDSPPDQPTRVPG